MPTSFLERRDTYITLFFTLGGTIWGNIFGSSWISWSLIILGLAFAVATQSPNTLLQYAPTDGATLLLALCALLSLWITADPELTFPQVSRLLLNLVAFTFLSRALQKRVDVVLLTGGFVMFGAFVTFFAPFIVQWHKVKGGLVPDIVFNYFPLLLSDSVHPNVMAALILLFFPLTLTILLLLVDQQPSISRWVLLGLGIISAAMLAVLLLTRSRGGYLTAVVSLVMIFALTKQRWLFRLMLVGLLGVIGWMVFVKINASSELLDALTDGYAVTFRGQVWIMALSIIRDYLFTGIGMGTFNVVAMRLYAFPPTGSPGAHNLYLQVGVDLGVLGLIAFLALFGTVLVLGWRTWLVGGSNKIETAVLLGCLLGLTTMLLHGLVDVTVWGTRMSFAPWLFAGVILAMSIKQRNVGK